MKIAFGHKCRSGKDTACDYLVSKYGGKKLTIAAPLYQIANYIQMTLGKTVKKDPVLLQTIGQSLRQLYGDNIWIDRLGNPAENVFVSDLRYKNEAAALKARGFTLVKIVKLDRTIDRDPNHMSEIDLDDYQFDYVIENNGTLDEFYQKLDCIFE